MLAFGESQTKPVSWWAVVLVGLEYMYILMIIGIRMCVQCIVDRLHTTTQVAACPLAHDGTAVEIANTQLTCHVNKSALTALTTLLHEASASAPVPLDAEEPPPPAAPTVPGGVLRLLQRDAFRSVDSGHSQQEPPGGRWFGRQGAGSTDSSEGPSSSRDPSEPGTCLRSPQVIENFVHPGSGGAPNATGALDLDVWHTDGDWEAPDHYGSWFVVPEGQAAFAVAVSHDGGNANADDESSEELIAAPRGSHMPAALYPDYVSAGPALSNNEAPKPLCARCAIAPLGPLFPPSRLRVVAREVAVLVRLLRQGAAPSTAEGASALVEVDVPRLCVQLDTFDPGQLFQRCVSVAVHELELRDWGVDGRDGAASPHILLGPFSLNRAPSSGDACVVHVTMQDVCPDQREGLRGIESRVAAACAALRVQLDQGALLLLEELASGLVGDTEATNDSGKRDA